MGAVLQRSHVDRETMSHLILTREEGPKIGLQIWAGETLLAGVFITDQDLEGQLRERGWVWPEASTGLDEAGCLELGAMVGALSRLAATGARSRRTRSRTPTLCRRAR